MLKKHPFFIEFSLPIQKNKDVHYYTALCPSQSKFSILETIKIHYPFQLQSRKYHQSLRLYHS